MTQAKNRLCSVILVLFQGMYSVLFLMFQKDLLCYRITVLIFPKSSAALKILSSGNVMLILDYSPLFPSWSSILSPNYMLNSSSVIPSVTEKAAIFQFSFRKPRSFIPSLPFSKRIVFPVSHPEDPARVGSTRLW